MPERTIFDAPPRERTIFDQPAVPPNTHGFPNLPTYLRPQDGLFINSEQLSPDRLVVTHNGVWYEDRPMVAFSPDERMGRATAALVARLPAIFRVINAIRNTLCKAGQGEIDVCVSGDCAPRASLFFDMVDDLDEVFEGAGWMLSRNQLETEGRNDATGDNT